MSPLLGAGEVPALARWTAFGDSPANLNDSRHAFRVFFTRYRLTSPTVVCYCEIRENLLLAQRLSVRFSGQSYCQKSNTRPLYQDRRGSSDRHTAQQKRESISFRQSSRCARCDHPIG